VVDSAKPFVILSKAKDLCILGAGPPWTSYTTTTEGAPLLADVARSGISDDGLRGSDWTSSPTSRKRSETRGTRRAAACRLAV